MLNDIEFSLSLIRHGESEVNINPDVIGQHASVKLTEVGMQQALKLKKYFELHNQNFDYIYSSTYLRAIQTSGILFGEKTEIKFFDELVEYNAGKWLGLSRKETLNDSVKTRMSYMTNSFLPPDGESLSQVERRASKWLEDNILYNNSFIEYAKSQNDKKIPVNIAVVSHGMVIKTLLHYVMGFDRGMTWKIAINNTSVTKLHFNKLGWHIDCINNCSHL